MLNPDLRHLLTDVLRPPTGWRLDVAVATTYTLDLTSLLLAPLSMAAYDHAEEGIDKAAPQELLEAIRRYSGRTTVFCQAGGIHVPSTYRKLTVFAEDSIVEVAPPSGRVFHPKIWVLRFINLAGDLTHRLACLSRNLTGDRSWDTVLVTDEDASVPHQMSAAPAAAFLTDLLDMSIRPVPRERAVTIRDLATTLRDRLLAVPPPFTFGELRPQGATAPTDWPVPSAAQRTLVVSPFLDATTVHRLGNRTTIVSRAETLDRLGSDVLTGHDLRVLQPYADGPPEEVEIEAQQTGTNSSLEVKTGLHAKVIAWDAGSTGHVLTGSANATSAAFGGNVEFGVLLSGPVSRCGAAAILKDDDNLTGFSRLLQPFTPSEEPTPDEEFALEREIEEFQALLVGCGPTLTVTTAKDGAFRLALSWGRSIPDVGASWARPITLKDSFDRPFDVQPSWQGLGLSDLSPFVAIRTRLEREDTVVERVCVIRADLVGAPEDRARRALQDLLSRLADVLRYLALLLRDPSIDDVASAIFETTNDSGAESPWGVGLGEDLVLLEPLVRAFARDDDSLERVAHLIEDLRKDDGTLPDLGPDFEAIWQVVALARESR